MTSAIPLPRTDPPRPTASPTGASYAGWRRAAELLLAAETDWLTGKHDLIALGWAGTPSDDSQPWSVASTRNGRFTLHHPMLGEWKVVDPDMLEVSSVRKPIGVQAGPPMK